MAQVSEHLIDDHVALDKVLTEIQSALRRGDVELSYDKLDLFWARLAVHIRAEHMHLFSTVLSGLEDVQISDASAPSHEEAQTVVAQLRDDHDFFMHQLALAIGIMRELLTLPEQLVPEGLNNVKKIVVELKQRLIKHNELEESKIYRWVTLLTSEKQAKLSQQITTELQKHPSRFTSSTWSNE